MNKKEIKNIIKIVNKEKLKIEFFSGWKPATYFLPVMAFSTKQALEKDDMLSWFCEIFVNGRCVYRECAPPNDDISKKKLEKIVLDQLVKSVFLHGIILQHESMPKSKVF